MYWRQSSPLASFQPMKGETNREPFLAGRMACAGLNTRVTLVRMPSFSSIRAAGTPASVQGILMTKLGLMAATLWAASIIACVSSRWGLISTETGNFS